MLYLFGVSLLQFSLLTLIMARNVEHFNNRGWRNYMCLYLQLKKDVDYCCLARLPFRKGLDFFFFLQVYFFILSERKFLPTLQKILNFQLSYWCGNFVGTHSFRRVSGESRIARNSSQTVRLRKMFTTKN